MTVVSWFLRARFVHGVAGRAWAGALIFIGWFLLPASRGAGPAGGAFIQQLVRVQKLPKHLIALMALTVLFLRSGVTVGGVTFGPAVVQTGSG